MVMEGVVWVSLGSRYGGKVVIDGFSMLFQYGRKTTLSILPDLAVPKVCIFYFSAESCDPPTFSAIPSFSQIEVGMIRR